MKLGIKLSLIFIILSFVVALVMSITFFIQSSSIIESRIENQLESINLLKKANLNTYIQGEKLDLEILAKVISEDYKLMLDSSDFYSMELNPYHKNILEKLSLQSEFDKNFIEFSILDKQGMVFMSTIKSEVGKIKEDRDYFINAKNSTFVGPFDYDISLQIPTLIISAPIKDDNGNLLGILAGRLNLKEISNLITKREGLGETLLVNEFNLVLTDLKYFPDAAFKKKIFTDATKNCLDGKSGFIQSKDYRDVNVFVYYLWVPDRNVCLITKIDESEALKDLTRLSYIMAIIFSVIIIVVSIISLVLAKKITSSIIKLKNAALDLSQGKWKTRLNIHTKDEIENLAKTFVEMTKTLKKSRKQLESYSKSLESKVRQRTKQFEDKAKEAEDSKKATLNIMEDVEETNNKLKETERLLRINLREMKKLDKQKGEFISITSHELKTPITSIKGFVQLLSDPKIGKKSQKRKKYLGIVYREVIRLNILISDILDLSRLDLKTVKFNYEKVDLKELLDTVRKENELKANKKKIQLIVEVDKTVPKIENDRTRLLQVFTNLVVNAINYTQKGYVKITANKEKSKVHFIVEDTGIGISKQYFEKIFERFYQVDSSLTREIGGTGLGLAITKELITKMQGSIKVESIVGKGTKFHVLLPIKQKEDNFKKALS
ncbi:MAG: HAMP domain-containing protein, partial [Nanoarchaeota archaeon]|nr:HAMP domain-containing protein [Nanoarchaeota archaeon]